MYFALIRMAFQRQLAYRTANLAGLATNAFFGLLRASVLIALFGTQTEVAGYTVHDAVTFTGLSQALLAYVAIFGWWDLMRGIKSGEIATDLLRPMDYFWYWWAQDVGRAAAQLLTRGLPILVLYALAYRITLPPTLWHVLALPASLALGLLISFAWRFLVSLTAFWVQDAVGVGRLAWTISMFMSGFLMPLALFPDWVQAILRATPFPGMVTSPIEIYLGIVPAHGLPAALALQAGWAVTMVVVCQVTLRVAIRRLVILGG
jgi:ABC-2 type transport system permease protein